jgi:enoyl-CoA hydratase/carnithine racemase
MVTVSVEDTVLRVRFASSDGRNYLTAAAQQEVLGAIEQAAERAVLLEAAGSFYCCGAESGASLGKLLSLARWATRPVIAAVQGPAMAEGVSLMAACHFVLAAQGASFALSEIREGRWPEAGWTALGQALGLRRLRTLALTGRVFSSSEALQWGLVHELAPAFELEDRALSVAAHLGSLPTAAVASILQRSSGQ